MLHFRAADSAEIPNTYPVTYINSRSADFQSDKDTDTGSGLNRYTYIIGCACDVANSNRDSSTDTNSVTDLHAVAHTHSKPYLDAVPNVDTSTDIDTRTDTANKHSNCNCYEFAYTDFHGNPNNHSISDPTSTDSYANRDISPDQHSDTHRYPGADTYPYSGTDLDTRSYVDPSSDMDACSCNRYPNPNSDTHAYSNSDIYTHTN